MAKILETEERRHGLSDTLNLYSGRENSYLRVPKREVSRPWVWPITYSGRQEWVNEVKDNDPRYTPGEKQGKQVYPFKPGQTLR